jgi:exosortase
MTAAHIQAELKRVTGLESFDGSLESLKPLVPAAATAIAFILLFGSTFASLAGDWWNSPEAGHGLLLFPVAIWWAWREGIRADARGNAGLGMAIIVFAVLVRVAAGLAAELFSMRASMVIGMVGLTVFYYGVRQVIHWWLPFVLMALSVPLPELVTQALALPLQFKASQMGAALLQMRDVPVRLTGNVIRLPGQELFVTEACSGLRSLTALISLAVLLGALMLRSSVLRILLLVAAIPIAVVINGVRVFFTGFLVYFVDPKLGQGFMHVTEGWLLFIVSLTSLTLLVQVAAFMERRFMSPVERENTPEMANA